MPGQPWNFLKTNVQREHRHDADDGPALMAFPTVFYLVALILALVEEFQAQGRSILGWAVVLVCIGLLWGLFT